MTAKLTPFPIMWEQFTTGFLTGVSIKKLPLLHPRDGGGGGFGEQRKNRFELEFTTQYSQSFLFISETLNKGYQMIISKLNESVICFGSFLIIQELNKRL